MMCQKKDIFQITRVIFYVMQAERNVCCVCMSKGVANNLFFLIPKERNYKYLTNDVLFTSFLFLTLVGRETCVKVEIFVILELLHTYISLNY